MTTGIAHPVSDTYANFPEGPEAYREATWNTTVRALFTTAVSHAESRIKWYEVKGGERARVAKRLRWWSLFLFAVGTLTPMFLTLLLKAKEAVGAAAQAAAGQTPTPDATAAFINAIAKIPLAEIGYVLLAAAGALVIFDQFFDSSGSWIRYRQSQARLEVLLADLRFAWAELMTRNGGTFTDRTQAVEAVALLHSFVSKVEILAEEETKEWATRFNARIEAFDHNPNLKIRLDGATTGDSIVATPAAPRPGAGAAGAGAGAKGAGDTQGAGGAAPDSTTAPAVHVRLAIEDADTLDANSLQLSLNDVPMPIPANGLIELPLEVGESHRLVATGRRGGTLVRGELTVAPSVEDEGRPFEIPLA